MSDSGMSGNELYSQVPLSGPSSIRLCKLLPAPSDNELCCEIIASDINENRPYEAISYVWGDEHDKAAIGCNGFEIQVSRNLTLALKRFRHADQPRWLWADGICINQGNTREKNHQVQLMGNIYGNAEQVLIWLGSNDDLENAATCMKQIWKLWSHVDVLNQMKYTYELKESQVHRNRNYDVLSAKFDLPAIDSPSLTALRNFYHNPWFNRAWTFQEYLLAKKPTVFQGRRAESVRALFGVMVLVRLLGDATDEQIFYDILAAEAYNMLSCRFYEEPSQRSNFRSLLWSRIGSGCQLSSDLVYSLLAVTTSRVDLAPDYDLPFVKVFSQAMANIISIEESLNVLGDVSLTANEGRFATEVPSWIPDWRHTSTQVVGLPQNSVYKCAGASKPMCSVSEDGRKLTVRGSRFASIRTVDPQFLHVEHLNNLIMDYLEARHSSDSSSESLAAQLSLFRTFFRDLVPKSFTKRSEPAQRWSDSTTQHFNKNVDDFMSSRDLIFNFVIELQVMTTNSIYFITSRGQRGMATSDVHENDIVVMLLGCDFPAILSTTGTEGEFRFIDFCYIEGVMDGEVLEDTNVDGTPETSCLHSDDTKRDDDNDGKKYQLEDFVLV